MSQDDNAVENGAGLRMTTQRNEALVQEDNAGEGRTKNTLPELRVVATPAPFEVYQIAATG